MVRHIQFGGVVAAMCVAGIAQRVSAQGPARPGMAVRVYNQAAVASEILNRAQEEVDRIYRDAGVQIRWVDSTPEAGADQFAIQMIIRPKAVGFTAGPNVMGTTLGDVHRASGTAFIFKDRMLRTAHSREQDVALVLAYAIAHEVGHVLLPYPAHSTTGIMRAEWNGDDLRYIASGALRFTPTQDALTREKLTQCCDRPMASR